MLIPRTIDWLGVDLIIAVVLRLMQINECLLLMLVCVVGFHPVHQLTKALQLNGHSICNAAVKIRSS